MAAVALGCRAPRVMDLPAELSESAVEQRMLPASPPAAPVESRPEGECARPAGPIVEHLPADPGAPLTLDDAIVFALENNPRLRVYAEQVAAARAGEDVAFAPFLPQFDFSYHFAGYSKPSLPAGSFVPAILNNGQFALSIPEIGVQWTLCDFGRTAGRYGQAVTRTQITELQMERARQTIVYETAAGYYHLLLTRALLRIREQAVKQAEAILKDTRTRLDNGTADRNALLRADVEVSESRETLVAAQEQVYDAAARLNVTLGRNVALPLNLVHIKAQPQLTKSLEECLEVAIVQREEVNIVRRVVAEAQYGEQAARAELLPKIYVRGSLIRVDSPGSLSANVAAAGIHLDQSLYTGGRRLGELRQRGAAIRSGIASGQVVLDNIALEVNLAYRAIDSNRERIRLGEVATAQARENLRLTNVKYDNGNATPTDIVDAQTAFTRALMRYNAAIYDYLAALAQLDYALGTTRVGTGTPGEPRCFLK
jgi:outer membrane protein TolC